MEQNTQDKIWDHFQNNEPQSFDAALPRYKFLISSIDPKSKVLNIGVGSGKLEEIAIEKDIIIYSLDPSKKSIKNLKNKFKAYENNFCEGYSSAIPFSDKKFDYVIMTEVLEHLNDDILKKTMSEVQRVLKDDGFFLGTVPNNENLSESSFFCPSCNQTFHKWGHVRSFTVDSIRSLFRKNNFSISLVNIKMFIAFNTLNKKGKLEAILMLILYRFGLVKKNTNIFFKVQ